VQVIPAKGGRPVPGYSLTHTGGKVPDGKIEEWLCELVEGDGFPYGYRKLTVCLQEDYQLYINPKKVYRLCKKLGILRPQRRIKQRHPRRLARKAVVDAPNQLWQMDIKYGYISGTDQFFFQLSCIDVFDREVIDYHLGLDCKAKDACRVLSNALRKRQLVGETELPRIRTDNGPQFIAHAFEEACDRMGLTHERIPVKTPNMNAYIEAFHSVLEDDCYSRHDFASFLDAYKTISEYMIYYNHRRRHGSILYMAPAKFHEAFLSKLVNAEPISA
jgi:putative transposase